MEETTASSSRVIYPVCLQSSDEAIILPFLNRTSSYVEMYSELPTATRTGRVLSLDLKSSVKTILTNVAGNQFFGYFNFVGDTRFY